MPMSKRGGVVLLPTPRGMWHIEALERRSACEAERHSRFSHYGLGDPYRATLLSTGHRHPSLGSFRRHDRGYGMVRLLVAGETSGRLTGRDGANLSGDGRGHFLC